VFRSELCTFVVVLPILSGVDRVVVKVCWEGRGHGRLLEAGSVWSRLTPELSKVEIRASSVPQIHRLGEPSFGVKAVEDNCVDGNSDDFDNDLNESTDE